MMSVSRRPAVCARLSYLGLASPLFTIDFESAGLDVRYNAEGLMGRGLYLGRAGA